MGDAERTTTQHTLSQDGKSLYKNDHELVDLLLIHDQAAWEYLCTEIIAPLSKSQKYFEMFRRHSIPLDSIVGQVYSDLIQNDFQKLRRFRFEGPLKAWLFFQIRDSVKKILRENMGKIPLVLSENGGGEPYIGCAEPEDDEISRRIYRENANYYIAQLWKKEPMKAYVLLLRTTNGLSAREVAALLGQSDSNIAQLNHRAKAAMLKLREEAK
jgi:DNA-directed RNA polymerase specialized sigma subunit, sigma24 homolog